jgi:hypothetical protein
MKLIRQLAATSVIAGMALVPVGGALADNVTSNGTTGPDSDQNIVINTTSVVDQTNVNTVVVSNTNVQEATTGDVVANGNTSVGGLVSGDAINTNGTTTAVVVDNGPEVAGGSGTTQQPGSSTTGGSPAAGGGQSGGSASGAVLGAQTVGGRGAGAVQMLPAVGPLVLVDVSALRAAWQPATAPTTAIVKQTRTSSLFMLVLATLLGVAGGITNAVYLRRKEGRS